MFPFKISPIGACDTEPARVGYRASPPSAQRESQSAHMCAPCECEPMPGPGSRRRPPGRARGLNHRESPRERPEAGQGSWVCSGRAECDRDMLCVPTGHPVCAQNTLCAARDTLGMIRTGCVPTGDPVCARDIMCVLGTGCVRSGHS